MLWLQVNSVLNALKNENKFKYLVQGTTHLTPLCRESLET